MKLPNITLRQLYDQAIALCWNTPLNQLPPWERALVIASRTVFGLGRDLVDGHLTLRAMSLVFSTLLSMVPMLAFSLSVSKSFGAHELLEPLLVDFLEPLGAEGANVAMEVIGFVDRIDVSVLGFLGLGFLVITVISLVQKIENSFNFIWHVSGLRPVGERFSNYLSVILVGPLLIASALGLANSVMQSPMITELKSVGVLGAFVSLFSVAIPTLMLIGAFSFIYIFMPNTRVKLKPALIGAAIAALTWHMTVKAFGFFVVSSTQYSAIYSSFAIIILVLIWLYCCWLVLLIGSDIAFYIQNPEQVHLKRESLKLSHYFRERLALNIMVETANRFHNLGKGPTIATFAERFSIPEAAVVQVIRCLTNAHLLTEQSSSPTIYMLAQPAQSIEMIAILQAIRFEGEKPPVESRLLKEDGEFSRQCDAVIEASRAPWKGQYLIEWVQIEPIEEAQSKTGS